MVSYDDLHHVFAGIAVELAERYFQGAGIRDGFPDLCAGGQVSNGDIEGGLAFSEVDGELVVCFEGGSEIEFVAIQSRYSPLRIFGVRPIGVVFQVAAVCFFDSGAYAGLDERLGVFGNWDTAQPIRKYCN